MALRSRYSVGIDLGTTNTAIAYADLASHSASVRPLPILQLVGEGELQERRTLPSYLYLGGTADLPPGALAVPWDADRDYAVGEFARKQGARVPGRLVSSAKSWLCHGGVDRDAPILPWGGDPDVPKLSPVDVSARYLSHVREVWNLHFPDAPLEEQHVVLTVPASFDEVARELTWQAAQRAGLANVVLLEEPQAALYAWIDAHAADRDELLASTRSLLVVDVGGGTTDFSLVAVRWQEGRLALERIAVGDHILLGGDNMDMALARAVEQSWGEHLDTQRFFSLVQLCREAKETLLAENSPSSFTLALPGRGRSVVVGARSATFERDTVVRTLLEGFFPVVSFDARLAQLPNAAVGEWGLPFAPDPAVSNHLAAFLRQHSTSGEGRVWPDTVLFNGGALKPATFRRRIVALLEQWSGRPVRALESTDLDLAVACGAAYYGLARQGRGLRIGGGAARTYYLGVGVPHASEDAPLLALCVVERGMQEGESRDMTQAPLELVTNRAVRFPLFASSQRTGDRVGNIVTLQRQEVSLLPPICTVLRFGKKLEARRLPVHLAVKLTEVGTVELWCVSHTTPHRWRLQFDLRDTNLASAGKPQNVEELVVSQPQLDSALGALRGVFPPGGVPGQDPVRLVRQLEDLLGASKEAWPLPFLRLAWDVLWEGRAARFHSADYEARWYNLAGFFLRPGFGAVGDQVRVAHLWRLRSEGIRYAKAAQVRAEWWNLWKRIAGGLERPQQQQLYVEVAPYLLPRLAKKRATLARVGPQEIREYWQLLANCELLSPADKAELGNVLLDAVRKGKAAAMEIWALGRLGARMPLYGPLNCVVAADHVARWVEALLDAPWDQREATAFALAQLARYTGDRERDLPPSLRRRAADRIERETGNARIARMLREVVPIDRAERARILDESLPAGLVWAEPRT